MENRIKHKNLFFILLVLAGLVGMLVEAYQLNRIDMTNQLIKRGGLVTDEAYPAAKKFTAAYQYSGSKDYKHAIQSYSQLLETKLLEKEQAKIQYNIGNNLFLSGLSRLTDDGKMKDETRYDLSQAKLAYEQSLRLAPDSRLAKFNLSLLLSVLPADMKHGEKEQSGMELSNLPIGLP